MSPREGAKTGLTHVKVSAAQPRVRSASFAKETSMFKSILVPATGSTADEAVFAAALKVARQFTAHLEFLHVRIDPAEAAGALVSDAGGATVSASLMDRLESESAEIEEKAQKFFQAFCERERIKIDTAASTPQAISASWHREMGRESTWTAEYGRTADLLVIGRPFESRGVMPQVLEAALFDSGRPLLIPSVTPVASDTVAIAWKSTREAARAVAAAMPFLAAARRIVILAASEDGRSENSAAARLQIALQRHGLTAETRHLQAGSRKSADALLEAASEIDAGLLVMGGYGHSRLREFVFGGVTEHVIQDAPLPVLMAH